MAPQRFIQQMISETLFSAASRVSCAVTKSVLTLVTGISLALANIQSDVLRLDAAAATVTETDLAAIREATRGELLAVEAAKI